MNPEGETTSYTYHPTSGVLWKVTDPLNRVSEIVYDHRGNVVRVVHPDLWEWSFGYDLADQLIWQRDETGATTTFEHDAAGRVIKVTDPAGVSTTTSFDSLGRPERLQHDSGRFEEYSYDVFNRVVGVETPEGTASTTYGSNGR